MQGVALYHEPPFRDALGLTARLIVAEPLPRLHLPFSSPAVTFGVDSASGQQSEPPVAAGGAVDVGVPGGEDDVCLDIPEEAVLLSGTFFDFDKTPGRARATTAHAARMLLSR